MQYYLTQDHNIDKLNIWLYIVFGRNFKTRKIVEWSEIVPYWRHNENGQESSLPLSEHELLSALSYDLGVVAALDMKSSLLDKSSNGVESLSIFSKDSRKLSFSRSQLFF